MSIIIFSSISIPFCSEDIVVRWYAVILHRVSIKRSVNVQSLVNFSFHYSNWWLFNSEIGHFYIETMEMNSIKRVSNVTCKFWLTDFIKASLIWNSTSLVEFSEKSIEINNRSSVGHKLMPVWAWWHNLIISLKFCIRLSKVV